MTQHQVYVCFKAFLIGIFAVVGIYLAMILSVFLQIEKRAAVASSQLLDCTIIIDGKTKGNPACLQSQILAITGSARATMGAVAKAAPDVAASVRAASSNSVAASKASIATAESATALLTSGTATIDELHATIKDLHASVQDLFEHAGPILTELLVLETTLDKQITEQSPEIGNTLKSMQRVIGDPALLDTLGHIDETAINVQAGTKHLADTAETIDIATRDLRKKAGQIKWLIDKILGMIKVTIPLF